MPTASALADPSTPVFFVRSEPARSTNSSLTRVWPPAALRMRWILTRQWLRDERSFSAWLLA